MLSVFMIGISVIAALEVTMFVYLSFLYTYDVVENMIELKAEKVCKTFDTTHNWLQLNCHVPESNMINE